MSEELLSAAIARFPTRLKELRAKAGMTQSELAKRAKLRQATIAEYETGAYAPAWPAVVRLAYTLGVTPDAFLAAPSDSPK